VIRIETAELQHLYQMGSDGILILIIVTNKEFKESYEKEVFRQLQHSGEGTLK